MSLGMKPTKIHKVLKFKRSAWMKKYTDFNTEKRMDASNKLEKDFFKIADQFCLSQNNGNFKKKKKCQTNKL